MILETQTHECAACGGSGSEWDGDIDYVCPVCLGAGRISDKMSVRDAVADAETLGTEIAEASYLVRTLGLLHKRTGELAAVLYARGAARAAFRAVPGLRGDR